MKLKYFVVGSVQLVVYSSLHIDELSKQYTLKNILLKFHDSRVGEYSLYWAPSTINYFHRKAFIYTVIFLEI